MMESASVSARLSNVLGEIEAACERSGRKAGDVTLVAVSKRQPLLMVQEYLVAAEAQGVKVILGESYVQELKAKRAELGGTAAIHLIGPLQRNKVRDAVKLADVIESVHSVSVLEEIAAEARKAGKRQPVFLQVNISHDGSKSGFAPEEVVAAIEAARALSEAISLHGLMTITALYDTAEEARGDFRRMAALRSDLVKSGHHAAFMDSRIQLSMGMSADFAVAIEEGADLVRLGTALFADRE